MRIAYFDPYSGASGDMILGALVDSGLSLGALRAELAKLPVAGYAVEAERVNQHGLSGTRVTVTMTESHPERTWGMIRDLIGQSGLSDAVKLQATAIFRRLAEAEGKVHGTSPDEVHFHEVGGVDAIVDVCGACIGLALLGIERVFAGPLRLGTGFVRSRHGLIPVPGPATAELLARANAPTRGPISGQEDVAAELLTPTGAAILTSLATFQQPDFSPAAVGYGFGTKELLWPNSLRLWIGDDATPGAADDTELLLETNIDDMNPQGFEMLSERLFAAGAVDVWLTPITMKKGRPAIQVSVLCQTAKRAAIEDVMIANSTTLGIRSTRIERTKAPRRFETVTTRWGDVKIKLRGWQGRVIDAVPEYDDCARIARETGVPLREVWFEAHRFGEVYVGRRLTEDGEFG